MGKSYRKPYVYMTKGIRESHASDKQVASQSFRAMAKHDLRTCLDWDELLTPHRFEARHNNVYSWAGDGHARYEGGGRRWRNLDNPFYYSWGGMTFDEAVERMIERQHRYDDCFAKLCRK